MSMIFIPVGVQTAVYVGDYNGSGPLRKIMSQRTGGITIIDNMPRNFVPSQVSQEMAGLHKVTLNMTFLADDSLVERLAKGISTTFDPSNTNNSSPNNTIYSIFLLHPIKNLAKSFWFPRVQIVSSSAFNYNKDATTKQPLSFEIQDRDWTLPLKYRDTYINFSKNYLYPDFQGRNPLIYGF